LTIEKSKVEDITGALNKYNEQLLARARITATTNKLIEVEQKLLDTQQQFEDADPTTFQTIANFVTAGGQAFGFAAKQAGDFNENLADNTSKLAAQKAALEAQLKSLTATGAAVETVTKNYEKLNVTPKGDAIGPRAQKVATPGALPSLDLIPDSLAGGIDTNARIIADALKGIQAPETNTFLKTLGEELALIQQRTDFTGNSFQGAKDKIALLQSTLAQGLETGELATSLEFIKEQLAQAEKSFDSVYSKTLLIQSALSAGLGEFSSSVEDGVSSFKELAQAAQRAAIVIVKTLIQQGVAAAIANTLKGATGLLGLLAIPIAGAAGALAAGLFSSLIGGITAPKLALGGLAYGETLATVGDNPNASIDPEVIAPLSKLKSILGDGGGGTLEARISGNDLLILLNRAQFNNRRTNG